MPKATGTATIIASSGGDQRAVDRHDGAELLPHRIPGRAVKKPDPKLGERRQAAIQHRQGRGAEAQQHEAAAAATNAWKMRSPSPRRRAPRFTGTLKERPPAVAVVCCMSSATGRPSADHVEPT